MIFGIIVVGFSLYIFARFSKQNINKIIEENQSVQLEENI